MVQGDLIRAMSDRCVVLQGKAVMLKESDLGVVVKIENRDDWQEFIIYVLMLNGAACAQIVRLFGYNWQVVQSSAALP